MLFMQLTRNFELKEFCVSDTFPALAAQMNPTTEQINNCLNLCHFALQPIRNKYDYPIKITSGIRSPALNAAIGGVLSSQHSDGSACDFKVIGLDMEVLYHELAAWWPGELIYYKIKGHIHIALPKYGTKSDHFISNS